MAKRISAAVFICGAVCLGAFVLLGGTGDSGQQAVEPLGDLSEPGSSADRKMAAMLLSGGRALFRRGEERIWG